MATKPSYLKQSSARLKPQLKSGRAMSASAQRARRKFLRFFTGGFSDGTYLYWERNYRWDAHDRFCQELRRSCLRTLIDAGEYEQVVKHAVTVEARTNLLFSFEKMALRDAVRSRPGARA